MMLRQVSYNGTTWTNTYDVNGLRAKRESTGKTYSYTYNGSQLSRMTVTTSAGTNTLTFSYDASGRPVSVIHNGTTYYYVTNLQGDVVAILNASGNKVTDYTYDAWGNHQSEPTNTDTIGNLNPLRYRGYVYDTETGLYYLQSRYYDPEVGRFINADGLVATGLGLLGDNMFAYCNNNPANMEDSGGTLPIRSGIGSPKTSRIDGSNFGGGGRISPRSDLANAPDLDINTVPAYTYNCYGNGIGKQINADPTGYTFGDSTRKTFEAVKMDLGSDNVRELDSIDAPIGLDEFKVAMKCGPTDFHFIRLTQDGWYNKSGDEHAGLYLDQSLVTSDIWYPAFIVGDTVYMGYISDDYPYYDYETIYFAVKVSWDEG